MYNISGWISSNDWIKKLKWDDGLRYIPLPLQNGTEQVLKMRMSILVLRCDFAAFGISPLPYDVILSNNSEVKHNWTQVCETLTVNEFSNIIYIILLNGPF